MRVSVGILLLGVSLAVGACGQSPQSTQGDSSQVAGLNEEFGSYDQTSTNAFILQSKDGGKSMLESRANASQTALIYYVVDTEEPFYQATVDYEVRSLRSVCDASHPNTNWIAFLNSWIVYNSNLYLTCVNGVLSQAHLSSDLTDLITKISADSYDNAHPTEGLKIALTHKPELNKLFKSYPLAHPEVLWHLLDFATTQVFPVDQYALTMTLKSHGSNELMLAGLTVDQKQEKIDRQKTVLSTYLQKLQSAAQQSNADIDLRNRVSCEAAGGLWQSTACFCPSSKQYINQYFGTCDKQPGYAGLGTVNLNEIGFDELGLGPVGTSVTDLQQKLGMTSLAPYQTPVTNTSTAGLGGNGLGGNGLGGNGLGGNGLGGNGLGGNGLGGNGLGGNGLGGNGLGGNGLGGNGLGGNGLGGNGLGGNGLGGNGLGFDDVGSQGFGLNTSSHFGTPDSAMLTVLSALKDKGATVDFLIFEACSTDFADKPAEQSTIAGLGNIAGYYSAKGSMWYRSVDWQTFLTFENAFSPVERQAKTLAMMDYLSTKIPNFVPKAGTAAGAATPTPAAVK